MRRPWLTPLILAILTLVFLRPVILPPEPGQALDGQDFRSMFYPLHQYIRQTLRAGDLPLWNPHQFIGHPVIGNPHAALFYPATWFMWLVGVERGMNLALAFHTFLAAWGMAWLTRGFGAGQSGAILGGVVYAMSGWAAARYYIGHYNLLIVFAWTPWLMAAYRHALARGTSGALLPGIAIFGLVLLAGHPPLTVYTLMALVALLAYHALTAADLLRGGGYAALRLAALLAGGGVLAAALVIPAAELTLVSARSGFDLSFANSFALPPAQLISLALPGFFGNPKVPPYFYWGADFFEEFTAYVGLLPLIALPVALRWRAAGAFRHLWFFLGMIGLGLVISVGLDGALMPVLWRWLPGFTAFRTPARGLYFVLLGLSGLTATFVTALGREHPDERRKALQPALKVWLPIGAALAFGGAVFFSGWYASASHVEPMPLRALIVAGALASAGVIALGVWLALWMWAEGRRRALLLTGIVVVLDAWHVAIPIITVSPIREDGVWAGARINVPNGAAGEYGRVVGPGGFENLASVTGHFNVAGYDPLPVERYRRLREMSDPNEPQSAVNTLLGVKYFLTEKPYENPDWELIGIAERGIFYRRKTPFPRAWIAQTIQVEANDDAVWARIGAGNDDLRNLTFVDRAVDCPATGAGEAEIITYRPNDVVIRTRGGGGLLILSDQYYPGWRAVVDDQGAEIVRADTVFRGICVPAGEHTVRFEYRPLSLYIGVAISAVGWLVAALWGLALALGVRRAA